MTTMQQIYVAKKFTSQQSSYYQFWKKGNSGILSARFNDSKTMSISNTNSTSDWVSSFSAAHKTPFQAVFRTIAGAQYT